MSDVLIPFPPSFKYIDQFHPTVWAEQPSKMRCGPASTAMIAQIAYPGRWVPEELEHELYVKWAGPDVASDQQGVAKEQIMQWMGASGIGIGYIDLQLLVDEYNQHGDITPLHNAIMGMNNSGIPQLITVHDEAYLVEYGTGKPLHPWTLASDPNHAVYSHVMVRVGYGNGFGYYLDPAAAGFAHPVKIGWDDVLKAGIQWMCATMPHAVSVPPEGLHYDWSKPWPVPPPVVNHEQAASTLHSFDTPLAAIENMANVLGSSHLQSIVQTLRSGRDAVLADIGK